MRLTRAQRNFLNRWLPVQDVWLTSGTAIGAVAENGRERLTFAALVRKGAIDESGQATDAGRKRINRSR